MRKLWGLLHRCVFRKPLFMKNQWSWTRTEEPTSNSSRWCFNILSVISLKWCFSRAWLLRNGCHTTIRSDVVLFVVMLFLHTRHLVLSALTPSWDKFQFNEFCLDWKRNFYIFSHQNWLLSPWKESLYEKKPTSASLPLPPPLPFSSAPCG